MNTNTSPKTVATNDQYNLAKILGIWAAATLPMAVLSWIIFPLVAPDFEADPLGAGVTRVVLLTLGLVWQFVLSMIIVRQEEGDLRWTTIKRRLRLNAPQHPKTGERQRRLWLWVVPALIGVTVLDIALSSTLSDLWVSIFPFFAEPPGYSFDAVFESAEIMQRLVGAWWFLGLFVLSAIFNTVLGEEFLFRGVLLPKMEGVFGKWSWLANGVLFGFYHLHQPWAFSPASSAAPCAKPSRRNASAAPGWRLSFTLGKACSSLSSSWVLYWGWHKMKMNIRKIGLGTGVAVGVAGFVYALVIRPWQLRRGATDDEVQRAFPGDDLVRDPKCGYTHAINIQAPASEVWRWLVQIGYKRAGWYCHDWLHRLMGIAGSVDDAHRSANRIIPELQDLKVGDVVEIAPGMGYVVVDIEPEQALVLHSRTDASTWESVSSDDPLPEKYLNSSWVWLLEAVDEKTTRLVVRVRSDYSPGFLNTVTSVIPSELGSLVMQPKTLQGIKQRAEMNVR